MHSQGLRKYERMSSKRTMEALFRSGQQFFEFPFRVIYAFDLDTPQKPGAEFAISVPKKKIPQAAARNRIKRMVRESYRLSKSPLLDTLQQNGMKLSFFIIFVGTAGVNGTLVREKIILILERLHKIAAES